MVSAATLANVTFASAAFRGDPGQSKAYAKSRYHFKKSWKVVVRFVY